MQNENTLSIQNKIENCAVYADNTRGRKPNNQSTTESGNTFTVQQQKKSENICANVNKKTTSYRTLKPAITAMFRRTQTLLDHEQEDSNCVLLVVSTKHNGEVTT